MKLSTVLRVVLFCSLFLVVLGAQAEVMIQWFESEWEEMYRKMPVVSQIGYDYIWAPPPTKAPTGLGTKWGNVGYSLYDNFDIGDVPQRGSYATRYGTRGHLRNMVDAAHRLDVKIIPDIVMNHRGNGPDIRTYPNMVPTDFHVQYSANYCNDLNFKRAPTMTQWSPNNGYGGTMWQDLANLIDIRTEDHPLNGAPKRFTGPQTIEGVYFDFVDGTSFIRHVGQYERYPYAYTNENSAEMLYRWIVWLGNAIDYDGLRLDAGKHTPYEFFGWKHAGFLHEAQYNFSQRRGFADPCSSWPSDTFNNYLLRTNALIFAEILSEWSEINYWFKDSTANPMRFLDYKIKKTANDALNGNIGAFYGYGTDFGPNNGIMYIWGHDEGPASKANLGYAYILTHIGLPMVYYTGNNINWDDSGRSPDKKTWMVPGHDSQALGDIYNDIPNLVWINQQFARGSENNLWHDGDILAYERYDSAATSGKGLLVVALNDTGSDQTRTFSGLQFDNGTVLHNYSTCAAGDVTVNSGSATITIPGNGGQGWVCYAPRIAETLNVRALQSGVDAPTMTWVVPGGAYVGSKTQQITRITSTNFAVDFTFAPPSGGSVDSAMMKWGQGRHLTTNYFDGGRSIVSGQYEKMEQVNSTNWRLNIVSSTLPEGLNVIKCRSFVSRGAGYPALFNTATKVVYVDNRGPDLTFSITNNQSITGDAILTISNADYLAYQVFVAVDGVTNSADELIKGSWRFNLTGLSAGAHTLAIRATESDWATARSVINSSAYSLAINVTANPNTIGFYATAANATNKLPFFGTGVNAPGSPSSVKLYWNGYELPFNAGTYSNAFNHDVVFRDLSGNVRTDKMWGAFVNGANFFEAVRVDGGATSRATRRIVNNLYGINAIDSDGDSIPDNVEMPFIDSAGAPGADQPWPGDGNKNFIPESWETWSKLNPYNHSTYYSGQWDDRNDFDRDGYDNGTEVMAGYNEGNIYKYNIYDSNSKPTGGGSSNVASAASWTPSNAVRSSALTITYYANGGALSNKAQVVAHIGHSKKTMIDWQDVIDTNMTSLGGGAWQVSYLVPSNASSVDFTFNDGAGNWDGKDWQANVQGGAGSGAFTMDGDFNGANGGEGYTVFPDAMKILAAENSNTLYVATWSTEGSDAFIYITDEIGDAKATPWAKAGYVFFDTSKKPYLGAEQSGARGSWLNNVTGTNINGTRPDHLALEASFNLVDAFGYVPEAVYIASVAYDTGDGGHIASQGPYAWDAGDDLNALEFQKVPIASIRDQNLDGYFDMGKPQMWTVVNGNTNDANYGLRRVFLNELAGDSQDITVILQPNANGTVSDVELFSNLNRRDFALLPGDEDPDTVTVDSRSSYYRAYAMTSLGGGRYSYTISANKCGAYRINARYKVNGGAYVYYTDNGLRRDCAVVVTPKKALDLTMYELNPMIAEARDATFAGRSTFSDMYRVNTNRMDAISTNQLRNLSMNMVWLQPIHPIGSENRQTDPSTSAPYDPGSPYAVRNYWEVNSILGDPSSRSNAMVEFQSFVSALDGIGVGVMLDGTFNHSAWDCEIGSAGVDLFPWASDPNTLIREIRPQWYSKYNSYGQHATYYESGANNDIAPAPDRMDFGKWNDAADFFFGKYDALVQGAPADTNWAWSSKWYSRYLMEEDDFEGFATNATRELWQYFAHYPTYWIEKTGHPEGTPKAESYKGIDGLRCDFAQGLPSLFWEYTINKTRSVKWDFLFMAESLDGYSTVNGDKHHGVGYRSARHFDILNENMVYYWRDNFFAEYSGGTSNKGTPNRTTSPTQTQFDNRKDAFANVPLLLNLTSHDDVYSTYHQPSIMHAYASLAAMSGVPMLMYGQESGAQNHYASYNRGSEIDPKNNYSSYESNFGKSIINFKRYNCMTSIWAQGATWMPTLRETYGKIARARLNSPALQSQNDYFLSTTAGGKDESIFAVAKFEAPGVSAATQDVVLVFVNNDSQGSTTRANVYTLNADYNGKNWFGIEDARYYNVVNLLGTNPTKLIWDTAKKGSEIKTNFYVSLNGDLWSVNQWQIQYLKLIDTAVTYPTNAEGLYAGSAYSKWDRDNDGLPTWWKVRYGLTADNKPGDMAPNGMTYWDNYVAGTAPSGMPLEIIGLVHNGTQHQITWASVTNINYHVERAHQLVPYPEWQSIYFGTALGSSESVVDYNVEATGLYYRIHVNP